MLSKFFSSWRLGLDALLIGVTVWLEIWQFSPGSKAACGVTPVCGTGSAFECYTGITNCLHENN